jgi:hypothetical protein
MEKEKNVRESYTLGFVPDAYTFLLIPASLALLVVSQKNMLQNDILKHFTIC